MKRLGIITIIIIITVLAFSVSAQEQLTYVTKGFPSRDAMLSAFFALTPAQQTTAHIDAMTMTRDCFWSDPWVMTYRGGAGETDGFRYETTTIAEEQKWVVDWISHSDERTLVKPVTDRGAAYVLVRWKGPFCVAIP